MAWEKIGPGCYTHTETEWVVSDTGDYGRERWELSYTLHHKDGGCTGGITHSYYRTLRDAKAYYESHIRGRERQAAIEAIARQEQQEREWEESAARQQRAWEHREAGRRRARSKANREAYIRKCKAILNCCVSPVYRRSDAAVRSVWKWWKNEWRNTE